MIAACPSKTSDAEARRAWHCSLGAQGLRFLLQFLSQILLARLLVPADFGLVAMAIPVLMLAQTVGELGLAQAVIQRPTLTKADMSMLFWLSVLINAGLAVLMIVTAPVFAWLYHEPRLTSVLAVLAAECWCSTALHRSKWRSWRVR